MKHIILTTVIAITTLSGCSSTYNDRDLIDQPHPFVHAITQIANNSLGGNDPITRCKEDASTDPELRDEQTIRCNTKIHKNEFAAKNQENKENRQRQEALETSFKNRASAADTSDIIEQQRRSNDWIGEGEKKLRPIVVIDKQDEFD